MSAAADGATVESAERRTLGGTRALLVDLVGALRSIAANQRICNLLAYRRQLVAQGAGRPQLESLDEALTKAGMQGAPTLQRPRGRRQ